MNTNDPENKEVKEAKEEEKEVVKNSKQEENVNKEESKEKDTERKNINAEYSKEELERLKKHAKVVEIRMRRPSFFRTIIIYLLILLAAYMFLSYFSVASTKSMTYTELVNSIEANNVSSITVQNDRYTAKVLLKDDKEVVRTVKFVSPASFMDYIQPYIAEYDIELDVADATFWETLEPMLPNILLLGGTLAIFIFMLKKTGQGNDKALSFGKNRAKMYDGSTKDKITFDNVAGLLEEKEEVKEVVDFLKNPKKYRDIGARIPRGMLFVGGPGTR